MPGLRTMGGGTAAEVAPWLQGLDTAWEEVPIPAVKPISEAKGDRSTPSRIPRRSQNVLHSSGANQKPAAKSSAQKHRSPLATLTSSENNTLRRHSNNAHSSDARSVSGASEGSVVRYSTVQQRAKSSSPVKHGTPEWKRRLLQGQVGYGDQTDLFGPSGLDNIFANPAGTENSAPHKKVNVSWAERSETVPMPSSPPQWPSTATPPAPHDPGNGSQVRTGHEASDMLGPDEIVGDSSLCLDSSEMPGPVDLPHTSPEEQQEAEPASRRHGEATQDDIGANRTIGGQTELEQEDFSPVFISKHTTLNGQIGYKAMDSHVINRSQGGLIAAGRSKSSVKPVHSDEERSDDVDQSAFTDGPNSESSIPAPDLSLSENLPTGTPPVSVLGGNVEVRRGGYSRIGSFRHRLLSPSQSAADPSVGEAAPELLSPLSTSALQLPEAPSPPRLPRTPAHANSHAQLKPLSSGSPLKLFGPHDTFTNNRLLRRMSQLDPDLSSLSAGDQNEEATRSPENAGTRQVSAASFGSGDLDRHPFNAEITVTSASDPVNDDSDRSPGSEIAAPGSKIPLEFRYAISPAPVDTFKLKRGSSKKGSTKRTVSFQKLTVDTEASVTEPAVEPTQHIHDGSPAQSGYASAKRPPTTPGKDSTPKRRRTLHFSEVVGGDGTSMSSHHKQLRSSSTARKRKDARKGDDMVVAEPDILAQRKILRPRNSASMQRQKEQIEAEIRETAEEFISQEPERVEAVMEQIESSMAAESPPSMKQQAHMMANEVAKFSLRVQKASGDQTERKRSVTTQDFFDEAVMVMKLIRERAGRQSVLGSVAESDQEAFGRNQDSAIYDDDPSSLRVSRPPSREGGSGWRPRSAQTTDARILSHLRKFEEKDDTDFIAESLAVLEVRDDDESQIVAIDEEANIRISAPRSVNRSQEHGEGGSAPDSHRSNASDPQTLATHHSAGTSTARTLHTSSTRKSEKVGTLGPDAVAHLIGDHVGGMIFDKEKRQWVRSKGNSVRRAYGSFLEPLSTITSDDDPFREISDLPVDQAKEEEIRKASFTRNGPETQQTDRTESESEMPSEDQRDDSFAVSEAGDGTQPTIGDGYVRQADHPPSDPSNLTAPRDSAFGSSQQQRQQQVETRATSWDDEDLEKLGQLSMARTSHLMMASALHPTLPSVPQASVQTMNLPSSFLRPQVNSPDESVIHHQNPEQDEFGDTDVSVRDDSAIEESVLDESAVDRSDSCIGLRDDTTLYHDRGLLRKLESPKLRHVPRASSHAPSSIYRTANRQVSLRRKTLNSRLKVDAMEHSELSFVAALPGERKMTMSLSLSRPISSPRPSGQVLGALSPARFDQTFILSDLPDFTISEEDPERPSEKLLAQRLARYAVAEADDRFSLEVKDLVRTLTDVNEGDHCWKELRCLDLQGRSLNSLYGLDDFCAKVQDMDLSRNAIAHLEGAPVTIRHLIARANLLSSLTSWTHLMNLQYLDISGNRLDDLSALGGLVHLRELRADDNQITSIDGVQHLDGLLELRVRRNQISDINLEHSRLHRLEELDACDNQISTLDGLTTLTSLRTIRLDRNPLHAAPHADTTLPALHHLSLQACTLHALDVTPFPSLRTLRLDDNHLPTIHGISTPRFLDLLSLRRQSLPSSLQFTLLSSPLSTRILHLSGTPLPSPLPLPIPQPGLEHLSLASCGLSSLPPDFGPRLPNLRSLNLNFNSLRDPRPLLNLHALRELQLAGNLLARLRKTVAVLGKLAELHELDLRDNPLAIGFHAPNTAAGSGEGRVVRRGLEEEGNDDDDEDEERERIEMARYRLPDRDEGAQRAHVGRMEEGIGLRRRVYLMLLANGCGGLRRVDGGEWEGGEAMVRDGVWERLVELGIVRRSVRGTGEEE